MSDVLTLPNALMPIAMCRVARNAGAAPRRRWSAANDGVELSAGAASCAAGPRSIGRRSAPARDALADLVRSYVLTHIERPITLAELVVITGVGERALRHAVAAETGVQLSQFMTNIRLGRARALLSTNRESRSVGQLAAALGFGSAPVFSRAYRKRFGEAVSETRRRAVYSADPAMGSSVDHAILR